MVIRRHGTKKTLLHNRCGLEVVYESTGGGIRITTDRNEKIVRAETHPQAGYRCPRHGFIPDREVVSGVVEVEEMESQDDFEPLLFPKTDG